MSTETLKFFEKKNSEEIINWMLENLSEDQIRLCLDQSGIPNTNLIETQGKAPMTSISPSAATERSILLLKGLVYGIPEEKYEEALAEASRIISERKITTIAWDGDKYTYPGAGGAAPATSFTRLLPMLRGAHPNLEFLFFKKEGKAKGLLVGGAIEADDYGNVLGPIPFMSEENTTIIREEDAAPPPPMAGRHYGCEFGNIAKWYELGLRGMQYCKEKLGAESVEVLILGLGGVVKKENEKIDEEPGKYPNRNFTIINVDRESTTSPGAGSSTDPLPVIPVPVVPGVSSRVAAIQQSLFADDVQPPDDADKWSDEALYAYFERGGQAADEPLSPVMPDIASLSIDDNLLYNYRNKCKGTQYIIKSVSNQGIEYYEFKEIDNEDDVISSGVTIGNPGWVKKTVPAREFDEFCTDQDIIDFQDLKEGHMETFLGAPLEVKQVSNEYKSTGLEPPLPEDMPQLAPEDNIGDLTTEMLKAIEIQRISDKFIIENFPKLYEKNLTMFPVFVYGMDNQNVLFLKAQVDDGKLILVKGFATVKVLNMKFKGITTAINEKIEQNMYSPSENIQEELNEAVKKFPTILPKIRKFYNKDYLGKFGNVNFGTLDDEIDENENENENENAYPDWLKNAQVQMNVVSPYSTCKKKISDMSLSELESRARDKFGDQYVRDYVPVKYVNSLGYWNVKYVKRANCISENPPVMSYNNDPIINGFGMDYGSDLASELLFG